MLRNHNGDSRMSLTPVKLVRFADEGKENSQRIVERKKFKCPNRLCNALLEPDWTVWENHMLHIHGREHLQWYLDAGLSPRDVEVTVQERVDIDFTRLQSASSSIVQVTDSPERNAVRRQFCALKDFQHLSASYVPVEARQIEGSEIDSENDYVSNSEYSDYNSEAEYDGDHDSMTDSSHHAQYSPAIESATDEENSDVWSDDEVANIQNMEDEPILENDSNSPIENPNKQQGVKRKFDETDISDEPQPKKMRTDWWSWISWLWPF